jgi:hypothetical protein
MRAILLFFVLFFSFNSFAQKGNPINLDSIELISLPKKVDFGFLFGPNFTNHLNPTSAQKNAQNRAGFILGLVATYRIVEQLKIDFSPSLSFDDYNVESPSGQLSRIDETLFNLPSSLSFCLNKIKLSPTIYAGGNVQYDLTQIPRYNEPTRSFWTVGAGISKKLKYFTFAPRLVYGRSKDASQISVQLILRG